MGEVVPLLTRPPHQPNPSHQQATALVWAVGAAGCTRHSLPRRFCNACTLLVSPEPVAIRLGRTRRARHDLSPCTPVYALLVRVSSLEAPLSNIFWKRMRTRHARLMQKGISLRFPSESPTPSAAAELITALAAWEETPHRAPFSYAQMCRKPPVTAFETAAGYQ